MVRGDIIEIKQDDRFICYAIFENENWCQVYIHSELIEIQHKYGRGAPGPLRDNTVAKNCVYLSQDLTINNTRINVFRPTTYNILEGQDTEVEIIGFFNDTALEIKFLKLEQYGHSGTQREENKYFYTSPYNLSQELVVSKFPDDVDTGTIVYHKDFKKGVVVYKSNSIIIVEFEESNEYLHSDRFMELTYLTKPDLFNKNGQNYMSFVDFSTLSTSIPDEVKSSRDEIILSDLSLSYNPLTTSSSFKTKESNIYFTPIKTKTNVKQSIKSNFAKATGK